MTTITINERTKAGKTLLELAKILAATSKGVIIDANVLDKATVIQENYSPQFLAKIKAAEKEIKAGKTVAINTKSVWESIK
jgi:ribosomal protein S8E